MENRLWQLWSENGKQKKPFYVHKQNPDLSDTLSHTHTETINVCFFFFRNKTFFITTQVPIECQRYETRRELNIFIIIHFAYRCTYYFIPFFVLLLPYTCFSFMRNDKTRRLIFRKGLKMLLYNFIIFYYISKVVHCPSHIQVTKNLPFFMVHC